MIEDLADIRPTNFEERLQCLSAHLTGLAKRKHQPLTFDPFTDALSNRSYKIKINNTIRCSITLIWGSSVLNT